MSATGVVTGPLRHGDNYPLHDAAYCCNISRARELIAQDPFSAQQLNPKLDNGTVLHSCARGGREKSQRMAQLLLDSLASDSVRNEIVNKLDSLEKSALYYAVGAGHGPLVEFLLNTGFIHAPLPDSEPHKYSLTHLAVQKKGGVVLKHLIEHGFPASDLEEGQTPLHLCVLQPESTRTEECLKVLVHKYTAKEVNLRRTKDNKTGLHLAAESCSPLLVRALLEHPDLNLLLKVPDSKKTALDLVVESSKKKNSVECLRMLMMAGTSQEGTIQRDVFCDTFAATETELCPLDLAFQIRATKMVETIVTSLPNRRNWMDDTETSGKKYLSKMYELAPAALPSLMSQCLTLSGDGSDVHADFGVIRGYLPTSSTDSVSDVETRYLRQVLDHPNEKTVKSVILHPLVQLFLEGKQRKLNWLNVTSIFLQGIWLILYTSIVGSKYETYDSSSCHSNETDASSIFSGDCVSDSPTSSAFGVLIVFFLILTVLVNLKEVVQLMNDGQRYFHDSLNWLQIISFVVAIIVAIVGLFVKPPLLFLVLAAFGFLMGCVLFLRGFGTFHWCGIYIFAVGKVIPRTASLVLIFLPILIGFRQNLKILLPALKNQLEGSFQGVTKVLVVMTGEYEYNGIFEENQPNHFFAISGSVGFIVFVIIGFALLNTLTALTVDDISRLTKDARFRMSETRIRQIHHWEMFVARVQKLSCLNWNLSRYLLLSHEKWRNDGDSTVVLSAEKFISLLGDTIEMDELIRE